MRWRSVSSGNGRNVLNSGAMNLGKAHIISMVKPVQTSQTHSHQ